VQAPVSRSIVVTCSACGQRNRVPLAKAGAHGKCGQCKAALPSPDHPLEVERADDLRAVIQGSALPVLVDFWAQWCGPCRMVAPELEKVAASTAGRYLIVKVNTDALPELGDRFTIRSIPTMAVFSEGREIGRTSGARPARDIEAFVEHAVRTPTAR
jgi:thioredoxin 2